MNKENACALWTNTCQTEMGVAEDEPITRENYLAGAARALDIPIYAWPVQQEVFDEGRKLIAIFLRKWADALDQPICTECSICHGDLRQCQHTIGRSYDGEECCAILSGRG